MFEQWTQTIGVSFSLNTLGLLLALFALETVLSADNAVALAALVQPLANSQQQRQALNWGLMGALVLRIALLFTATWIIRFWQVELVGALYLLWLAGKHFWARFAMNLELDEMGSQQQSTCSLWQLTAVIALTDLAFSLDSVTTAVAISDQTWIVLTGCMLGVITLRFLAGLFVECLERFTYLQDAAYITVLGVGLRLLCKALQPAMVPPDWIVLTLIIVAFAWGFSKRALPEAQVD
jgi:YkoY family integral membrane protein